MASEERPRAGAARRGRVVRRGFCLALLALLVVPNLGTAELPVDPTKAARVKAAYLRYIAEFTTWPQEVFSNEAAPIVLGLIGTDPNGVVAILERGVTRRGLLAQGRPIELLRLPDPGTPEFAAALRACHVLFITGSDEQSPEWEALRTALQKRPIVTIAEIPGFSRAEGMIEFVIDATQSRVTMHIDLAAVECARLRLSSRLLSLKQGVHIVQTGPCRAGAIDEPLPARPDLAGAMLFEPAALRHIARGLEP